MADRQIVVLDIANPNRGPNDPIQLNVCFWLAVPVGRQSLVANPSFVSIVKPAPAELAHLQAGALFEVVASVSIAAGSTLASAEAQIQALYTAEQTAYTSVPGNRFLYYGSSFDGATWTVNNIP